MWTTIEKINIVDGTRGTHKPITLTLQTNGETCRVIADPTRAVVGRYRSGIPKSLTIDPQTRAARDTYNAESIRLQLVQYLEEKYSQIPTMHSTQQLQ